MELCACTGVYAAGSAAKYANGLSGHADVAGEGMEDGSESGRIAAWNMSRAYVRSTRSSLFQNPNDVEANPRTKDPLPLFRSDVLSYAGGKVSSLLDVGINALCVGNCDSERFFTHGLWWTNLAAQRRFLSLVSNEEGAQIRKRRTIQSSQKPAYGIGVVFYLDRTGRIHGIMTWGLPFTTASSLSEDAPRPLNQGLVEQMKDIIRTNGGFHSLETEADHVRMSKFLADQSRQLVAQSFRGYSARTDDVEAGALTRFGHHRHLVDGVLENFPRPLHRFTEVRPPNLRSVRVLKRKDGNAQGVLGEDLFTRYQPEMDDPAAIDAPDPAANVGSAERKAQSLYEWNLWERMERRWDENEQQARPAKEELLWLRKGDEVRTTSARENVLSAYNAAIWSSTSR